MLSVDQKQAFSFLVACEEGSMRGASERLDIEASSISRQIKSLETALGVILIERGRRGVMPTEAGDLLLNFLRGQRSDFEALLSVFDELRGMSRGEIQIAVGDGFVSDLVGNALDSFVSALPGLTYSLEAGSTDQILHAIKTDQAHLGIAFNSGQDRSLRVIAKSKQPLKLLVDPKSEFADLPEDVSLSMLPSMPCALLRPGFGVGAMIKDVEALYGLQFRAVMRTNSLAILRNFVREGLGVTFLPAFVVTREIADGTIITKNIDVPELSRGEVSIFSRHGRRLPEGAVRFANHAIRSMMAFSQSS